MNRETLLLSNFGETLKAARKRKRLTQKQLAQMLGVHYNTISSWELGTYLPEARGLVLELAHHLDLDESETRQLLEASLTALSPRWNIPYQRNPFFTSRDDILCQLHHALHHEHNIAHSRSCALSGLGGIGKTQTAIEYAYRYTNDYSAIFWVKAQTHDSLIASFVDLANLLNLPEKRDQEQNQVVTAVIHWLNGHDQWLLIFDNIEDIALLEGFLPAARRGSLLFTSRRQALGITAHLLNLEPMTPEEGMGFLLQRARLLATTASLDQFPSRDKATAREIVIEMGGLPLALDQAGSFIEATHCSLSDYLRLYRSSQLCLLDEREAHADHPISVTRTFSLAFAQLEQNNIQAVELLTACAFLAPEAIPEAFFREGATYLGPTFEVLAANHFAFHTAIKALLNYSLLQRNTDAQTVKIHRLVQTVLKESQPLAVQRMWATRVVHAMSCIFPSDETHIICEQLLPHALWCIKLSEQWKMNETPRTLLISHVATYLSKQARFSEAELLFQQALHTAEQALGAQHPLVAQVLLGLARLYNMQGKYEQAEPLCEKALYIREQMLGTNHLLIAEALHGLAIPYIRQGKYEQAEHLLQQALHIREQALGAKHFQVTPLLHDLANLYTKQRKYEQAKPLYKRALQISRQTLGSEHIEVARLLSALATLYFEQAIYAQAKPLYQRALALRQRLLPPEHPDIAESLHSLTRLYQAQQEEALSHLDSG